VIEEAPTTDEPVPILEQGGADEDGAARRRFPYWLVGDRRAVSHAALTVVGCVSLYCLAMMGIIGILFTRPSADPLAVASLILSGTSGAAFALYAAMKSKETVEEVRRLQRNMGPRRPRSGQVQSHPSEHFDGLR